MSSWQFGSPDKNKGVRENCKQNRMDKQIDRHNNMVDKQTFHHYNTIAQLKPTKQNSKHPANYYITCMHVLPTVTFSVNDFDTREPLVVVY